jgi:Fe-S-cluster containining protein
MNQPMRYFEWDFDNDIVIEYARSGECSECGACCMAVIRFNAFNKGIGKTNPILGWDNRNGEFINPASGVVNDLEINGKHRYFWNVRVTNEPYVACTMLSEDKRCKIHLGKHLLSRAWPMSPKQVTPFAECTYMFEEIGRWKISELEGAPV